VRTKFDNYVFIVDYGTHDNTALKKTVESTVLPQSAAPKEMKNKFQSCFISSAPMLDADSSVPQQAKKFYKSAAPAVMVTSASPEKYRYVSLSQRFEKKSGCMVPLSPMSQGQKQYTISPRPATGRSPYAPLTPDEITPTSSPSIQGRLLPTPSPLAPRPQAATIDTTPSSFLSVPQQVLTKITPTQPPPLQANDQPPPAPKAKPPPRRMSGQHDVISTGMPLPVRLRAPEAWRQYVLYICAIISENTSSTAMVCIIYLCHYQ
jgi:hypothetical protein